MKRFFKLVSMFVLAGATLTYTGCTDYDKDIDNLGQEVDALEGRLATLEQQVKNLESLKSQLETLKNTHDADVERLDKAIGAVNEALKGYATREWAGQTFVTKTGLQEAITALGTMATKVEVKVALDSAKAALGNVRSLKNALGAYASEGAIQAALDGKLDAAQFNAKFDAALAEALKDGGKISKAIADAIDAATAEFAAMFYGELRSLVFIPDLYVGGIEAAEFVYVKYNEIKLADAKVAGKDKNGVDFVINGKVKATAGAANYINPELVVNYEKNPSTAKVGVEDLAFITRTVETRAAAVAPEVTRIVADKDGNISVGMKAQGQLLDNKTATKNATVFALQAVVEGKDTTVTSDYARLLSTAIGFDAIAYNDAVYAAAKCTKGNDHLWSEAKTALENTPTVRVAWDKTFDLKSILEVHYNGCKVYDMKENTYGLKYEFALIDYISGGFKTSDSQFASINAETGVIDPCATTNGVRVPEENDKTSIGRRPLVQVVVKDEAGKIVLVGYINVEIVEKADAIIADPFKFDYEFGCENIVKYPTWDEMVDNVLEKAGLSKEQFEKVYAIEYAEGTEIAKQYAPDGKGGFVALAENRQYGQVKTATDTEFGTTTAGFSWLLNSANMAAIYEQPNHAATIYIRYTIDGAPATSIYDGIYVPLTATVAKPNALTVGVKISEYWFNEGADAIINVHVPEADFELKDTEWITDIDQVWAGNKPVFKGVPTEGFVSYQNPTYKYYFSPVQPTLNVDGVDYKLIVASNKVYDAYKVDANNDPVRYLVTSNDAISTLTTEHAGDVNKGIFANVKLCANVWDDAHLVATLDPATGEVTYANTEVAKILLNAFASQPRSEAKLLANIGVIASNECNIAYSVENGVNPYHFLRPINIEPSDEVVFVDGVDSHEPEANVNLFTMFNFSDWRGRKFYEGTDYTNLWYFKYYNVKSVVVDIDNVTTTLNGGKLGKTKLTDVTEYIKVSHCKVDGTPVNGALDITLTSANRPGWGATQYKGLVDKFGYIHYQNNFSTVDSAFKLSFPVEITYEWGTVKLNVVATVNPTEGN